MVLTSDIAGMPSYVELATVCNTEDLYNMMEIIEAKQEFDEIARLRREAETPPQTQN